MIHVSLVINMLRGHYSLVVLTVPALIISLHLTFLWLVQPKPSVFSEHAAGQPLERRVVATTDQDCRFAGNSDIYGFGIRLGIYLQWVASILSKVFLVSESPGVLRDVVDANTIFSIAIFIATALLTTGILGNVHAVEILILLHIYFGSTYIVFFDTLQHAEATETGLTFWAQTVMIYITTGMSIYSLWFWFHGLDGLLSPQCDSFAFLFAQVNVQGPARTFFKIMAVVNMAVWGIYFALFGSMVLGLTLGVILATLARLVRLLGCHYNEFDRLDKSLPESSDLHVRYMIALVFGISNVPRALLPKQSFNIKASKNPSPLSRFMMSSSDDKEVPFA